MFFKRTVYIFNFRITLRLTTFLVHLWHSYTNPQILRILAQHKTNVSPVFVFCLLLMLKIKSSSILQQHLQRLELFNLI